VSVINKRKIGNWGESQACSFLIRQGYKIIARNYWTREGEIDIIAQIDNKISFIEVKTRTCGEDSAERSFDKNKKVKMFKAIEQYCQAKKLQIEEIAMYIEQISVYIDKRNKVVKFKKYLTSLD
jgi:putative endonuclease